MLHHHHPAPLPSPIGSQEAGVHLAPHSLSGYERYYLRTANQSSSRKDYHPIQKENPWESEGKEL